MNCKPGDLAVIVRMRDPVARHFIGRFVVVLHAAPAHSFVLPDGYPHVASPPNYWLCKFQSPIGVPIRGPGPRNTMYASIHDECLRPIRDPGDDATDETLQWLPTPSKETETA